MRCDEAEKVPGILAEIRKSMSPGRNGDSCPYAQAIYACFSEIEELVASGFTMATSCKYLEGKGVLPNNADNHSFRRAFRREIARRARQSKRSSAKEKNDTRKRVVNPPNQIQSRDIQREHAVSLARNQEPKESGAGLQINHDNTFRIQPIDPDDLPDVEKLGF